MGYSVSVACLIWVYRGFDWRSELERLAQIEWGWVTLGVVSDIAVYVCQGFRWTTLLRPLTSISPWKTTQAIYIGLFANEVLPFRSGEVIRCYLQRRWTGLPLSVIISSAVIERILDGLWLFVFFGLASRYVELPAGLEWASRVLLAVVAVAGGLLLYAVLRNHRAAVAASSSRWKSWLTPLVDGVHVMGRSRTFVWTMLLSFLYLALQVLPIFFLMQGYGLDLTFWAAGVVLVVLRLGTVVPQAPGNVGSFQALTILGLGLFHVPRAEATGFATLAFLVVTMPLWLGGFVALLLTRMRLDDIHRDAHSSMSES